VHPYGRRIGFVRGPNGLRICNFIAGFSPSLTFLLIVRAALGIGMGAEWPVGASLAMECWPARSRGFMGGLLQGGFALGFALASLACDRLARPTLVGYPSGNPLFIHPLLREGASRLGREPQAATRAKGKWSVRRSLPSSSLACSAIR
jgi:MFS family permease